MFDQKSSPVLNVFCTAGYPGADSTPEVIQALQESGVDMVEIGMPYSDPLADGPVIQQVNAIALDNGMSISKLFHDLQDIRKEVHIPLMLMGYLNPVLQYGFEKFCSDAAAIGIDGLIIPDLPDYEFEKNYKQVLLKYGLDFIFLITPETSEARVRRLDSLSSGFIYAVATSSITGNENVWEDVIVYLQRIASFHLNNPVLLGFGIKDHKGFHIASKYAAGAIVGSAYIKALSGDSDIKSLTGKFVRHILGEVEAGNL
jgi:tryptophan synthase alpha chain